MLSTAARTPHLVVLRRRDYGVDPTKASLVNSADWEKRLLDDGKSKSTGGFPSQEFRGHGLLSPVGPANGRVHQSQHYGTQEAHY
jgi:hypothetical protein